MRFSIQIAAVLTVLTSAAFQAVTATPIAADSSSDALLGRDTSDIELEARDIIADCRRTCGMRYDLGSEEYIDCVERCQTANYPGRNAKTSKAPAKSAKGKKSKRDLEETLDARDIIADCRRTCGMRYDLGSEEYIDCVERCQTANYPGRNAKTSKAPAKSAKGKKSKRDLEEILDARDIIADCRRTCGMRYDLGSEEYIDCVERCQTANYPGRNAKTSKAPAKSAKGKKSKRDLEEILDARDIIADCRRTCGMRYDLGSEEYIDCVERCQTANYPGRNAKTSKAPAKSAKGKKSKRDLEETLDARDIIADCRRTCGMRYDLGSEEYIDCVERCQTANYPGRNAKTSKAPAKSAKGKKSKRDLEEILDARDIIADCRRTCGMRYDLGSEEYIDCVERCQTANYPGRNAKTSKAPAKSAKGKKSKRAFEEFLEDSE